MLGKLLLSFWKLSLENLPVGRFIHQRSSPTEAKLLIWLAGGVLEVINLRQSPDYYPHLFLHKYIRFSKSLKHQSIRKTFSIIKNYWEYLIAWKYFLAKLLDLWVIVRDLLEGYRINYHNSSRQTRCTLALYAINSACDQSHLAL